MPPPPPPAKRRRTVEVDEIPNPQASVVNLEISNTYHLGETGRPKQAAPVSSRRGIFDESVANSWDGSSSPKRSKSTTGPYPLLQDAMDDIEQNEGDSLFHSTDMQRDGEEQLKIDLSAGIDVEAVDLALRSCSQRRSRCCRKMRLSMSSWQRREAEISAFPVGSI